MDGLDDESLPLSQPLSAYPHRAFAYVSVAMHDATIAAWESKYFYNRRRPAEVDLTLRTRVATPNSPSYPSEYAAAAGRPRQPCFPTCCLTRRRISQALAEEAGRSRLFAGVQFQRQYCRTGNSDVWLQRA